ncbi:hypothetical protein TIFTF001_019165 [Ficus carica]|uniref:Uncharacterized protein n=1 Tax=Ficus carica TaxID=3494 RepID=A0AA88DCD1_FICCA|nr:hypothetical protein TIFTF001_019165 [Ficus carica]
MILRLVSRREREVLLLRLLWGDKKIVKQPIIIHERLDRLIGKADWSCLLPGYEGLYLDFYGSDHRAVVTRLFDTSVDQVTDRVEHLPLSDKWVRLVMDCVSTVTSSIRDCKTVTEILANYAVASGQRGNDRSNNGEVESGWHGLWSCPFARHLSKGDLEVFVMIGWGNLEIPEPYALREGLEFAVSFRVVWRCPRMPLTWSRSAVNFPGSLDAAATILYHTLDAVCLKLQVVVFAIIFLPK